MQDTERCSPGFRAAAGDELVAALDAETGVVFAIDRDFVLQFVNPAWSRFALANGGEECMTTYRIGSPIRRAVPEVLWPFYEAPLTAVLDSGRPWEHDFDCSSPTEARWFRMRVQPLGGDRNHLIVSSDLVRALPSRASATSPLSDYIDANDLVVLCSHCRRCLRVGTMTWDWVPALLDRISRRTSHGLCEPCFAYHYPP